MSAPPVDVVGLGLGPEGLPASTLELIRAADVLAGGAREMAFFPDFQGKRIDVRSPLSAVFAAVERAVGQGLKVVAVASGDPLFHGLGRQLAAALGPQRVRVHPGISTLQAAAARLTTPWDDIRVVSLHGRTDLTPLFAAVSRHARVAAYTDPRNTPAALAAALLERGADCLAMTVLENLGGADERIRRLSVAQAAGLEFSPLNMVLLEKADGPELPPRLGLPDDALAHQAGLITKWPVRAAALAALELPPQDRPDGMLWDLGAGSGSVAIEAAALMPEGAIIAVERDPGRAALIRQNVLRTHSFQVQVVVADAGGDLSALPDPQRVFIGGGLAASIAPLEQACRRLSPGGVVVAAATLLDTLEKTRKYLDGLGWPVSILHLCASRSAPLAGGLRLAADNPVFLVTATKT